MHEPLFSLTVFGTLWVITVWKLIGYCGVALFGGRWLVQVLASRQAGRPVMPVAFWIMSVLGSSMLLSYFIWGKNDSVGILSNIFPAAVYSYNLFLLWRSSERRTVTGRDAG
jgi:Predicted membrane protein